MSRLFFTCLVFTAFCLPAFAQGDVKRGKYIIKMGGCVSCHKTPKRKNADLAGGHKIKTAFGVFYVPNITPDPETGMTGWSDEDFINAMTKGIAPDGSHYFPSFPYTSYTKMTRQDLLDLKAYLDSVPPVKNAVPDHELDFPYNQRFLMAGWKALYFNDGPFIANPEKSEQWNRGAYIAQGPAHCGECHTPRNNMGGLDLDKEFQGNPNGPDGEKVPSMLVNWSNQDVFMSLRMGMKPDGDFLGGSMGHVIGKTTSKLTKQDLRALVTYITDYHK